MSELRDRALTRTDGTHRFHLGFGVVLAGARRGFVTVVESKFRCHGGGPGTVFLGATGS